MGRFDALDPSFLRRSRAAAVILGGISVLYVALYAGWRPALGHSAGFVLALLNLWLLEILFTRLLRPDPRYGPKLTLALLAKLPLLFGGAALALFVGKLPAKWFLIGFSVPLVVTLLRVIGRMLFSKRSERPRPETEPNLASSESRLGGPIRTITLSFVLLAPLLFGSGIAYWTLRGAGEQAQVQELLLPTAAVAETPGHGVEAGHGAGTASPEHPEAAHGGEPVHAAPAHGTEGTAAAAHGGGEHGAAAHGEGHEEHAEHEFPNLIDVISSFSPDAGWVKAREAAGKRWDAPIFTLVVLTILGVIAGRASSRRDLVPKGLQNGVETVVEAFYEFIEGILGHNAGRYVPFLGSLFFFIWFSNLIGLVPFMKAPTSVYNTTVALAIIVFCYVQYTGLSKLGIKQYLFHLMGSPSSAVERAMVPLIFPMHVIGELAKPLSLSLRLFGNVMGEDTLLFVFAGLGVMVLSTLHAPFGVPLHLPFMFLAVLTSTIQALVFTVLSAIYFMQMLPHEHEGHDEHDGHGAHDAHAHGAGVTAGA